MEGRCSSHGADALPDGDIMDDLGREEAMPSKNVVLALPSDILSSASDALLFHALDRER